jgi:diguanylate cyclase (GGDEF)-like protein
MNRFSDHANSLDVRLAIALGLMLVPLLVCAMLAVGMLSAAGSAYTRDGNEAAGDVQAATRATNALHVVDDRAGRYAEGPAAVGRLRAAVQAADAAFVALRAHRYDTAPETRGVATASRSWEAARAGAATLISSHEQLHHSELDAFFQPLAAGEAALGRLVTSTLAERRGEQSAAVDRRHTQLVVLLLVLAVSLALAVCVARWVRRSIARPLHQLRVAARRFGAGDLGDRVTLSGGEEFAQVADAFNGMAAELRENQEQLVHQAFHDSLTGLPNRALLLDRTQHALARARREGGRVAALLLDLDDFKGINDTLGHSSGDQLLIEVARRLQATVRAEDTVARLGGDEFAVLLEGCGPTQAVATAQRVLEALAPSFRVPDRELSIRASVGVAASEPGADDADELLRYADVAMYEAKNDERGGYRVFEAGMDAQAMERLDLEADLRRALERSELDVHYQPIVDLETRRVAGIEALVRWTHAERGVVTPDEFIPLAERTRLIVPLGRCMVARACRDLHELQREDGADPALTVSVNVSAIELMEDDYVAFVKETLEANWLPPESLVLEITESVLVYDSEPTLARLRELKAVGVRLAVDDFGTGYSSLAYVERLPLDIIKIDKAFIDPIGQAGEEANLASVIVSLGQRLGLETVAEGIEAEAQGEELERMGCQYGQGFYYARPQPLDSVRNLIVAQTPHVSTV